MREAGFRAAFFLMAAFLSAAPAAGPLPPASEISAPHGAARLLLCAGRPETSDALCGTVSVFENRAAGRGRRIALHVVVLRAIGGGGSSQPPLFSLEGGPGLAATDGVRFWETELKPFRRNRDIVLLDQRGTGASNPLRCSRERRDAGDFLEEMYPLEYVRRCRSELETKADLTQYSTSAAADDIEDVRRALGYGRIDLIGLSYGSRLALVTLRQHPKSVRAAVLMGLTPTWAHLPLFHAANAQRALSLLLEDCAAEASCKGAYPDLPGDLARVAEALGAAPATASAAWPAGSPPKTVSITRDVFFETLRRQMYEPATTRRLPAVIHAAAAGNYAPFLTAALPSGDGRDGSADGLYLSITCSEDTSQITRGEAERAIAGTLFGSYRIDQQRRACAIWPTKRLPARYFRDVRSSVPVLILSGGRDPVTPPAWATRAARKLSRSRHVIVPLSAHLENGLDDVACWDRVVLSFLDRGTAEGLDVSCLARLKPAPFQVGPSIAGDRAEKPAD